MAQNVIPEDLLALLRSVDTPTVCNAIEVAQGARGFNRHTYGTMQHTAPDAPAIVGIARTARIAGFLPPVESTDVLRARRMEYFRSMASGTGPSVAVIEDADYPGCTAAWWGEVHVAVHKGLGLAGAITNGAMRDLGAIDDGFPILAGSIGVSHGFVHVVEIGTPVKIMGMDVEQDELVHADRHGALVIPRDVIPVLKGAIETMVSRESVVLGPAREPGFDIDRLEEVWAEFEAKRV